LSHSDTFQATLNWICAPLNQHRRPHVSNEHAGVMRLGQGARRFKVSPICAI
jgi:hypothetical protein